MNAKQRRSRVTNAGDTGYVWSVLSSISSEKPASVTQRGHVCRLFVQWQDLVRSNGAISFAHRVILSFVSAAALFWLIFLKNSDCVRAFTLFDACVKRVCSWLSSFLFILKPKKCFRRFTGSDLYDIFSYPICLQQKLCFRNS